MRCEPQEGQARAGDREQRRIGRGEALRQVRQHHCAEQQQQDQFKHRHDRPPPQSGVLSNKGVERNRMPATAAQLHQPLRVSRRASHSESRTRTRGKVCANFGFTENVMTLARFFGFFSNEIAEIGQRAHARRTDRVYIGRSNRVRPSHL